MFDPDFLREAYIKNYQSFTNRRIFAMGGPSDSGILNLTGEHWKYVRSSLSPTFTQGKLKQVPVIHLIITMRFTCVSSQHSMWMSSE